MPVFRHSTSGGFTQGQLDAAVAAQLLADKNAVDAKKASILPTVTDLLSVAGTMAGAEVYVPTGNFTGHVLDYFGYVAVDIGGSFTINSVLGPCRFSTVVLTLKGVAPQTVTITGDCTGGVIGDPTAPWNLVVYGVGVNGSTTILAANTGLGILELSSAEPCSGTLTINVSHNPLLNTEESPAVESLFSAIVDINLDAVVDVHGITTPLNAACWEFILIHMSTHAGSTFTTDPRSIAVGGSDAVTAGVNGTYAWNSALDKFVHTTNANLTISYASSKYKIFDVAVEKFRCGYLINALAWRFPNNTGAQVNTAFA